MAIDPSYTHVNQFYNPFIPINLSSEIQAAASGEITTSHNRLPTETRSFATRSPLVVAPLYHSIFGKGTLTHHFLVTAEFLYKKPELQGGYSLIPPGAVAIHNGNICFSKMIPQDEWKKKTIVVTDVLLEKGYVSDDQFVFERFLGFMMAQGFEVIIFTQEGLQKIKVEEDIFENLKSSELLPSSDLEEALAELKLYPMQIKEINFSNVRSIIAPFKTLLEKSNPIVINNYSFSNSYDLWSPFIGCTTYLKWLKTDRQKANAHLHLHINTQVDVAEEMVTYVLGQLPPGTLLAFTSAYSDVEYYFERFKENSIHGLMLNVLISHEESLNSVFPLSLHALSKQSQLETIVINCTHNFEFSGEECLPIIENDSHKVFDSTRILLNNLELYTELVAEQVPADCFINTYYSSKIKRELKNFVVHDVNYHMPEVDDKKTFTFSSKDADISPSILDSSEPKKVIVDSENALRQQSKIPQVSVCLMVDKISEDTALEPTEMAALIQRLLKNSQQTLKHLSLSNYSLSESELPRLNLPNLETLTYVDNDVTTIDLVRVLELGKNVSSLTLDLINVTVNHVSPSRTPTLRNLSYLNIKIADGENITSSVDKFLKKIFNTNSLQEIHYNGNSVSYLKHLILPNLRVATLPSLIGIETNFPKLQHQFYLKNFNDPLPLPENRQIYFSARHFSSIIVHNASVNVENISVEIGFSYRGEGPLSEFKTVKVFKHTAPREHRDTLSTVTWSKGLLCRQKVESVIRLVNVNDHLSPPYTNAAGNCFTDSGLFNQIIQPKKWNLLTGLSRYERITSFKIVDVRSHDGLPESFELITLGFDENNHQYFIGTTSPKPLAVIIEYHLSYALADLPKVSQIRDDCGITFIDDDIILDDYWYQGTTEEIVAKFVALFSSFVPGDVVFNESSSSFDENTSSEECQLINESIRQRTGAACQGVSELCCLCLAKVFPGAKIFLISSQIHAKIEFEYEDNYRLIELGGYPVFEEQTPISTTPLFSKALISSLTSKQIKLDDPKISKGHVDLTSVSYIDYAENLLSLLRDGTSNLKQSLIFLPQDQFDITIKAFIEAAMKRKTIVETVDIKNRSLVELQNHPLKGPTLTSNNTWDVLTLGGILILDLRNLSSSNIASLCQITDPGLRLFNGTPLHKETTIVGLFPENYRFSREVARRFDPIRSLPHFEETFSLNNRFIDTDNSPPEHAQRIPLYHDSLTWRKQLVENILPSLEILPGLLVRAILEKRPVVLLDIPEDPAFNTFLHKIESGFIRFNGEEIAIPEAFKIYFDTMAAPSLCIDVVRTLDKGDLVLNQQTFYQFFSHWTVEENGYGEARGYFEISKGSPLTLFVSESLTKFQWFKLLDEAELHHIQLKLHCSQAIELPEDIHIRESKNQESIPSSLLVVTSDVALSVLEFKTRNAGSIILHISPQTTLADLLPTFKIENNTYHLITGDFWNCLLEGTRFILTGTISNQLIQELAKLFAQTEPTLLSNGRRVVLQDQVTLITEKKSWLEIIPSQYHGVTSKDVEKALSEVMHPSRIQQLKFLLINQKVLPCYQNLKSLHKFFEAGITLPEALFNTKMTFGPELHERLDYFLSVWGVTPLAYIYGLPASGKTHFMTQELPLRLPTHHFYYSCTSIEEFLQDPSAAVLCIDEGDIDPNALSAVEGLLLEKPTVLFNHKIYTDLSQKQVVITGNAQFSNRKLLRFVETHGGAIYFKALPDWYIKEKILKPLLEPSTAEIFATRAVELYQEVRKENSHMDLRALQTVCALSHVYREGAKSIPYNLAEYCFLDIFPDTKSLSLQREFHQRFIIQEVNLWLRENPWTSEYTLTDSRKEILWKLICNINMKKLDIKGAKKGLLIEGHAGEGKTALIQSFIQACQLPYVRIDLTGDPKDVKKKLHDSFHAGMVIIMEEFDGFYEEDFNAFLTGVDLEGKPATKAGALFIGTANKGYPWRIAISEALDSRLDRIVIPEYTTEEYLLILKCLGVEDDQAENLVIDHEQAFAHASHDALKPTPADLFAKAKKLARTHHKRAASPSPHSSKR